MGQDLGKFFTLSPNMLSILSMDGLISHVNPAFQYSSGWDEQELIGKRLIEFVHSRDAKPMGRTLNNLKIGLLVSTAECRFRCKDGRYKHLYWTAYPDQTNKLIYAIAQDSPFPSSREEMFQMSLEAAPTALLVTDKQGKIIYANLESCTLFGYQRDELIGSIIELLVPERLRGKHTSLRDGFARDPKTRPLGRGRHLIARRKDGTEFPVEIGLNPTVTEQGTFTICSILDLTERKEAEGRMLKLAEQLEEENSSLEKLASTDSLTGLSNRRTVLNLLETRLRKAHLNASPISLIMLDIDHFKHYNDRFGHTAGDELLKIIAVVLSHRARRTDVVGRYGGEEFVIILPDTEQRGATTLAEEIRHNIQGYQWQRGKVTASFGVTTVQVEPKANLQYAQLSTKLIDEADQALYHSKRTGRNKVTHLKDIQETKQ
jgi:diguanylate cyclase (GGDEF)-like protein/PAS domain S-box-containing protein